MPWLQAAAPLTRFFGTCREPLRTTGVDALYRRGTTSFAISRLLLTTWFHNGYSGFQGVILHVPMSDLQLLRAS